VFVGGFPLSDPRTKTLIGYCPQVDPLLEAMNSYETLWFFGRIRGIPKAVLRVRVQQLIDQVGLTKHAMRQCGTYSGGNKRKLSLAVAMIGEPKVLLLDEPSTGMDPEARRSMWEVIESVSANRSIVLVSHSMEECEALCTRMAIMVSGKIKCLGSTQHIKSKFGAEYQIEIRCSTPQHVTSVIALLKESLSSVTVDEQHGGFVRMKTGGNIDLAQTFDLIESSKQALGILNYSVSQATLEQIFIGLARDQEEEAQAAGFHEKGTDPPSDEKKLESSGGST
jgi:ABC-type multidrug transport system ATPase subunit